jgi:hypothetical protein
MAEWCEKQAALRTNAAFSVQRRHRSVSQPKYKDAPALRRKNGNEQLNAC